MTSDSFQTTEGFFKYADLTCLTAGHDLQHRSAWADKGRSHLSGYRPDGAKFRNHNAAHQALRSLKLTWDFQTEKIDAGETARA
jgi:hypothetical protein